MTDNSLEIINAILSNIHTGIGLASLSGFYAPDFIYYSPLQGELNFDEHCALLAQISSTGEFDVIGISSHDSLYEVDMELTFFKGPNKSLTTLAVKVVLLIKENLVHYMKTTYDSPPEQIEFFKKQVLQMK